MKTVIWRLQNIITNIENLNEVDPMLQRIQSEIIKALDDIEREEQEMLEYMGNDYLKTYGGVQKKGQGGGGSNGQDSLPQDSARAKTPCGRDKCDVCYPATE
jgi:hypothetical protein